MASEQKAIYRFDRFTLDLLRGALLSEGGSELKLRPKSFELLRYMVVHAGRLMDRDELMQAVWPGVFVTDDSISQCVKEIRRALDDHAPRLLRTVPRRGYLLDVPVACVGTDDMGAPLPAAQPMPASAENIEGIPAPAANRPMVVVLPFENISDDPEQRYLAEGLAADLVTDLTHFQELCVVSPAGYGPLSFAAGLSSSSWPIPETANYVFAGTIRRRHRQIRVTIRLHDASNGLVLWAERYDRPLDELFALQEELAQRLPGHLVSQIKRETGRRIRRRPTTCLNAYDLCLRGRDLHFRETEQDTLAACEVFARAIELNPDYATAYAWQAYTMQRGYTHLWGRLRGRETAVEALRLARHSIEIESDASFGLNPILFI
jgi:TolB-like protein